MWTFALAVALKASVVLLGAHAASRGLRGASAAVRHLVWLTALWCVLLLPVAGWLAPQWRPALPAAVRPSAEATRTFVTVTGDSDHLPIAALLWFAWLAGSLALLAQIAAGHAHAARLVRSARPLPCTCAFPVMISDEIRVPMVCGVRRPVILLPRAAESWTETALGVVLCHEAAHATRRDPLWQLVADAVRALYWPLPWSWSAAARLRLEAELACDDSVLRTGASASDYAGHLVTLVRGLAVRPHVPQGAIPMAHTTGLETRLKAMLSSGRNRAPARRRVIAGAVLGAVCILAPLAALRVPGYAGSQGISGTVKDISGAAVPSARVMLMFAGTDRKEVTATDDMGGFSFSPLPDGDYQVQVAKPGFALLDLRGIVVEGGQAEPLQIVLQAGRIRESLTVTGESGRLGGLPGNRPAAGGNVEAPRLVSRVNPAYPPDCKAEGVQGTVLLRALLSHEGAVVNLEALNRLVDPRLVGAAVDAVRQWKYEPTRLNGEAVDVITEVEVHFVLR